MSYTLVTLASYTEGYWARHAVLFVGEKDCAMIPMSFCSGEYSNALPSQETEIIYFPNADKAYQLTICHTITFLVDSFIPSVWLSRSL